MPNLVEIQYKQPGNSTKVNEFGMIDMPLEMKDKLGKTAKIALRYYEQ